MALDETLTSIPDAPTLDGETSTVAPADFGLEVRPSQLGEHAGDGLFCMSAVPEGTVICEYTGRVLCTQEAMHLEDKSYLMRLGPQSYVDARDTISVLARYINDCRLPAVYNVRFDKRPDEGKALVVACRHICVGEELFVDYGKLYWASTKPHRLRPAIAGRILERLQGALASHSS
mmetsp:Transcript_103899/g.292388  ORF Transcript_103899/g.292388 Transcript_103899/m.292388 type:complete len:176 (+) Transcript_103899:92-619(+)